VSFEGGSPVAISILFLHELGYSNENRKDKKDEVNGTGKEIGRTLQKNSGEEEQKEK
jgi:hypothetical protein